MIILIVEFLLKILANYVVGLSEQLAQTKARKESYQADLEHLTETNMAYQEAIDLKEKEHLALANTLNEIVDKVQETRTKTAEATKDYAEELKKKSDGEVLREDL